MRTKRMMYEKYMKCLPVKAESNSEPLYFTCANHLSVNLPQVTSMFGHLGWATSSALDRYWFTNEEVLEQFFLKGVPFTTST